MNLALLSDLHMELGQGLPKISRSADVIVLAGDIDSRGASIEVARRFRNKYEKPVIVVAGNHEHYSQELNASIQQLRDAAATEDKIHFLENDAVQVGEVRFLGCTLWSDFARNGEAEAANHMWLAGKYVPDFSCIQFNDRRFTPKDARNLYLQSFRWLEEELAKPFDGKTIVVTHFAPHHAAIHPHFMLQGMDTLTPYFTPDCTSLIERYKPSIWCYGHTHNSIDIVLEQGTRLVSNQRGYPNETHRYTRFERLKLIKA